MPTKAKYRCTGCRKIVTGKCGCRERERGSSAARGYGARWRKFVAWFLSRHPRCEDCWDKGIDTRVKLQVHHKVKVRDDPRRQYDESNCMTLCESCHSIRTARGE